MQRTIRPLHTYKAIPAHAGHRQESYDMTYFKNARPVWLTGREDVYKRQADHGGHDRTHGSLEKEDMLIPLICIGPDFCPGSRFEQAGICDIAPTITRLSGASPAREWEGKSLI